MHLISLADGVFVSGQISPDDIPEIAALGVKTIVCNRPDGEDAQQPLSQSILNAAEQAGIAYIYMPVVSGSVSDADAAAFGEAISTSDGSVLAFCRSGMRSTTLWALSQATQRCTNTILEQVSRAGFDLTPLKARLLSSQKLSMAIEKIFDIVIVGAGAAGLAACASLLKRRHNLQICIIDPAEQHFYQPGWTMVGAGVFTPEITCRRMASLIPESVSWVRSAASAFEPLNNRVLLSSGESVQYRALVVAPGLKLDWSAIPGLEESLGENGVTSNYRFDLAPYTWELVQQLRDGKALFTQPPMPIKCAGAPQKAMYLSADHWCRYGMKNRIQFHTAGNVLFGVPDYVPALMDYIERYGVDLRLGSTLTAIDGRNRTASFVHTGANGSRTTENVEFDMIHVCPPQTAPDFIKASPLASESGWVEVDQNTLRHVRFENVFGLGDATTTPNAKTAAAARKQAPVLAQNVLSFLDGRPLLAAYDGYGSCPLTVERGKIVLAEFCYGGKLAPTFPTWLLDGRKPSRLAWHLKSEALPSLYWHAMLKGREWLCAPETLKKPVSA
ncbi:TIGR01244 family sulfur transferase [Pseudomonas sp. RAC1]|uniref:TIGR01244 family sulfur transferase n=1 Tax=Pseudomonas sp. RAC1 TaxID=3064900 RepID=UPI00271BDD3B|nr:TIGR01244 family sulfur transferase [Pseudomonas sp. RAC1]MDV9033034.1 TIGR01244 family sulfur transferase [Pseudomonas sp. RAC1]